MDEYNYETNYFFNSHVYTVKSVYRQKLRDATIKVSLCVLEEATRFIFDIEDTNKYKFLKKGAIITLHIGNGGYICIEEGKKLPEDDKIYCAEVKHTNPRIKLYRKNYK